MGLHKCPRCELNYIRDDEKYCAVCRRQMKGESDENEDLQNICIECGENPALAGQELCGYCLSERRRHEKMENLMEQPTPIAMDMNQLDEIDVPVSADIPSEDLKEMHKEFGEDDAEDDTVLPLELEEEEEDEEEDEDL
ncbi:MAG TPA: hypothetical protein VN366_06385 [Feifaniaceae bacterium]|nr:hypothetical protein [Feifaniaceae bacterium]